MNRLTYVVPPEDDGRQLGYVVRSRLRISKRLLRRLKQDEAGILLNGERRTVRAVVHNGDVVSVAASPQRESTLFAEAVPLEVVYEEASFLVCLKPRGVTMYPRYRGERGAFSGAVLGYLRKTSPEAGYYPIYRLDKGTSGLVLLAKSSHTAQQLNARPPQKIYQAMAFGRTTEEGIFSLPLAAAPSGWQHTGALFWPSVRGKHSVTQYRRLFVDETIPASGMMIHLPTGRRHQIRAHFAQSGHPLLGDVAYGGPVVTLRFPLLHVGLLCFIHPDTGKELQFFEPMQDVPEKWARLFSKEGTHVDYLARCLQRGTGTIE